MNSRCNPSQPEPAACTRQRRAQITAELSASGVAPFYYPIHAVFNLSGQDYVLGQLDNLQPGEMRELSLTISGVSGEELQQPMSLHLSSEVLIADQVIRFANAEDSNVVLQWFAPYGCEQSTETVSVGTVLDNCTCDVDGRFYDSNGLSAGQTNKSRRDCDLEQTVSVQKQHHC